MRLSTAQVAKAVDGQIIFGDKNQIVSHISLNSKEMQGQDLFVPLIGARVDAHRFLASAFENGAVCAFTSAHTSLEALQQDEALWTYCEQAEKKPVLIAVKDTKAALQALGHWYRVHQVGIPLVGVTGSVGKTTTREMIACALSAEMKVFATKGNANSQVSVPITITEINPEAEVGVIELGMSEPGEMARISKVAEPTMAVITNIGVSHINQLKTQENILIEKLHILEGAPENAILLLNADDPLLADLTAERIHTYGVAVNSHKLRLMFYGCSEKADIRAVDIQETDGFYSCKVIVQRDADEIEPDVNRDIFEKSDFEKCDSDAKEDAAYGIPLKLQVRGRHMLQNALCAMAVANCFGLDLELAAEKLSAFRDLSGRGETFEKDGVTVIDDSYNAAPASMKAGLSVLASLPAKRHIAVLADMLELGSDEKRYHREVGAYIAEETPDLDGLYLCGPLSAYIAGGLNHQKRQIPLQHFMDTDALETALRAELQPGDAVLFKGSNSMGLSKIVKDLFR